jgi:hypothetical protein
VPNGPEPKNLPQPTHVDYSKPTPLLPNPFARYMPRDVPPPSFTNGPKIEQLIQNGKLLLSMNDAIAIALADNLDIAVQRYNLPIADTDILRTKAGQSVLYKTLQVAVLVVWDPVSRAPALAAQQQVPVEQVAARAVSSETPAAQARSLIALILSSAGRSVLSVRCFLCPTQ